MTETRLAVLEYKVEKMAQEMDKMAIQVDEMHAILLQAKGVRWAIIATASILTFISGVAGWFIGRH